MLLLLLLLMMMMMMMIGSDVSDIHAVLEVFIYDENADKKAVFLGKVAIPLLRVCFNTIIDTAFRDPFYLSHYASE